MFREHVYVVPFHEDDITGLVDLLGPERVVFGSDWPHAEGLGTPLDFARKLGGLAEPDPGPDHAGQRRRARRPVTPGRMGSAEGDAFDYVVVGGGSAGCVVAGRLAAAGATVLVLEAGGTDRRPDVWLPAGVVSAYKLCNWKYMPEPDASRGGLVESWPAGKILGGTGSINGTVFVRGNPADFDGWAEAGCPGWDHHSVLPYFRRLETWAGPAHPDRGTDGPIHVGFHAMPHPVGRHVPRRRGGGRPSPQRRLQRRGAGGGGGRPGQPAAGRPVPVVPGPPPEATGRRRGSPCAARPSSSG